MTDWIKIQSELQRIAKEITGPKRKLRPYKKYTLDDLREMSQLRDAGISYTDIGAQYDTDRRYARKLILRYKMRQDAPGRKEP